MAPPHKNLRHKTDPINVIDSVQPEELALSPVRAIRNTGEWFEALFRDHYPRVVRLLTQLTGDQGQAEEIAADVFSKLARRSALLASREDVAAWVYRVATNAGLDALRANSRRRRKEEAAGAERLRMSDDPGALEEMLRQERGSRVRGVLSTLKPRDAQLLLLRTGGMAYREIAQTLGVQSSSVGTLLARAEREFERKYRARHGDDV
jgi:RNA polymerase sigma-70 factor (ECF subfamily)